MKLRKLNSRERKICPIDCEYVRVNGEEQGLRRIPSPYFSNEYLLVGTLYCIGGKCQEGKAICCYSCYYGRDNNKYHEFSNQCMTRGCERCLRLRTRYKEIANFKKPPITLGADPEFVLIDKTTKDGIPACDYISDGEHTEKLGTDGCTAVGEMRPDAGKPEIVYKSIKKLITELKDILPSNIAFVSGSYAGGLAIGGHIHFSGVAGNRELLKKLDKFITKPLNQISDYQRRRNVGYGRLSEFREQPHGWEYRSPCSWLSHPRIAKGVLAIAWVLAKFYNEIDTWKDLIKKAPRKYQEDIKKFRELIKAIKEKGLRLEMLHAFYFWRLEKGQKENPPPVPIIYASADYNMEPLMAMLRVKLKTQRKFTITTTLSSVQYYIAIYGASITRGEDSIFVNKLTMDCLNKAKFTTDAFKITRAPFLANDFRCRVTIARNLREKLEENFITELARLIDVLIEMAPEIPTGNKLVAVPLIRKKKQKGLTKKKK